MKTFLWAFAITALVSGLLVQAIPAGDKDKKDEKPRVDIRGTVTKLAPTSPGGPADILGRFLCEAMKGKVAGYDKAYVRVTKTTKIFTGSGKDLKPATFKDLKDSQQVEVTFTGPTAESYPVQATAGRIVILRTADEKK
jgi:hypothetical protein